jgi:predicted acylesterase/phospholipase RssA
MLDKPKQSRVERSRFEQPVLSLQGGGALGSYQAGVYQALAEADLHPGWVAGISISAVIAALIAGNPPERRVERCGSSGKLSARDPSACHISVQSTSRTMSSIASSTRHAR